MTHSPRICGRAGLIAWLLALLLLAAPARSQPDEQPEASAESETGPAPLSKTLTGVARAEYEAARVLFADGDFKNAIVKFQKAHALSKDARLLWNVAVCQKNLRQYSRMLVSIRRYREQAADLLTAEDRRQADAIVQTVTQFISDFDLKVNIDGAQVLVDGEPVGTTPLSKRVTLDVGRRTINIKKPGYGEQTRTLTVPGGGRVSLRVDLLKELHRGNLVVQTSENDLVSLDGKVVGKGGWKGTLSSGGHTLKVTAPDMQPFQQEVVIQDDKTRTVKVELTPVPTDSTATVLWVVGGVTLTGAAVVASVFLFQPSGEPPVEGSINPGSVQLSKGYTVLQW